MHQPWVCWDTLVARSWGVGRWCRSTDCSGLCYLRRKAYSCGSGSNFNHSQKKNCCRIYWTLHLSLPILWTEIPDNPIYVKCKSYRINQYVDLPLRGRKSEGIDPGDGNCCPDGWLKGFVIGWLKGWLAGCWGARVKESALSKPKS